MHKPFSDPKYIEKMIRELDIMAEQETLESAMLNWKGNPINKNLGHWVKYVWAKTSNPREMFLYWDTRTEDVFLNEIEKDILKNKSYFKNLEKYFLNSYAQFGKFTDNLYQKKSEDYDKLKAKELIALFAEFSRYHKRALAGYYIVYDLANLLPRLARKDIENIAFTLKIKNVEKYVSFFSTFGIDSLVRLEKMEFLKKIMKIQKIYEKKRKWEDPDIQKIIFDHWYRLGCSSASHGGLYYTLKDYQKKFKKHFRIDAEKKINKMIEKEKKEKWIVERKISLFGKYPLVVKHIYWMRNMMTYRNRDEEFYYTCIKHCWPFFEAIIRRINLSDPNDFWLLSKQEIVGSILGNIDAKKISAKRKIRGYTIKQVGNSIKVWTGVKKEDWHEKKVDENITEFKGVAAYRGKTRGKVKVIFSPSSENNKFKNGDILVTSMTTPDFVPLIKKAAAIVTDEGGLLCHASIVAREMKTICLIGTKVATKVLHDGDLVEVDANNNKVIVIKRANHKKENKYSKKRSPFSAMAELKLGR